MALSIMFFHLGLFGFIAGNQDSGTVLGRLGIYGVSIFFVLSGLSIAIAYDKHIHDLSGVLRFYVRRLFRIWPLLWLAIALVTIPAYLHGKPYKAPLIFLNMTTLYGFTYPYAYFNTGAWSIGNEMVYYALSPILFFAYHRRVWLGNVIAGITVIVGMLFSFHWLVPSRDLSSQWRTYINPFNNFFLFAFGMALFYNFRSTSVPRKWRLPLFLAPIVIFFLAPAAGDQITIVTGIGRVVFSIISVLITFAFYKCPPILPRLIGNLFEQFGMATYGIYLLHPIVIGFVSPLVRGHGNLAVVFTVVAITTSLSLLLFKYLESPMIAAGKKLTSPTARKGRVIDTAAKRVTDASQ